MYINYNVNLQEGIHHEANDRRPTEVVADIIRPRLLGHHLFASIASRSAWNHHGRSIDMTQEFSNLAFELLENGDMDGLSAMLLSTTSSCIAPLTSSRGCIRSSSGSSGAMNQQLQPHLPHYGWLNCCTNSDGRTLLCAVAALNCIDVAKTLISLGADPCQVSHSKRAGPGSALHEATTYKHLDMAEFLIESGASPFQCNYQGKTSMDLAINLGRLDFIQLFQSSAIYHADLCLKVQSEKGGQMLDWRMYHTILCEQISPPQIPDPPADMTMLLSASQQAALKDPNISIISNTATSYASYNAAAATPATNSLTQMRPSSVTSSVTSSMASLALCNTSSSAPYSPMMTTASGTAMADSRTSRTSALLMGSTTSNTNCATSSRYLLIFEHITSEGSSGGLKPSSSSRTSQFSSSLSTSQQRLLRISSASSPASSSVTSSSITSYLDSLFVNSTPVTLDSKPGFKPVLVAKLCMSGVLSAPGETSTEEVVLITSPAPSMVSNAPLTVLKRFSTGHQIAYTDVEFFEKEVLGKGSVGRVIKGKYQGKEVAVKLIHVDQAEQDVRHSQEKSGLNKLDAEFSILTQLHHPNILKIQGAGFTDNGQPFLVEDLCEQSLASLLYPSRPGGSCSPLSLSKVLQVSVDIMTALKYLHGLDIPVIHRDLKPGNVLIGHKGKAVISDFGLARLKYNSYLSSKRLDVGTVPYMAPECITEMCGKVSTQCDIYSFGVMLGEMLNHARPWSDVPDQMSILFQVAYHKKRPDLTKDPNRCPPQLRDLVVKCWDQDPGIRPNSSEVLQQLVSIQKLLLA
ncbi:hypothetical protein CEUSTIGMA_g4179.t1 [Chlamydomonas eustigma]|uniref:Protein kinase domain-containing protein n=1 Tax=Chlamydomonas eustigma TaxID=1157962 RepID=A0A250X1G5_9CHLO|nr:hypothetical protein CEUSTIGMA_g4179.t1 [Chlamydomonas eustigma]|eukprot:GAX76732.1 hypothetical protein CEUSTIGMA_g4179.t1 [Chlamydomonas eustigma]